MRKLDLRTHSRSEFIDITERVQEVVRESGVKDGVCFILTPHTTAGITINENADPTVRQDMLRVLDRLVPWDDNYAHSEGNSAAHVKASLMGSSVQVLVKNGRLELGTWQGIYFCEFDGPRTRQFVVETR